MVDALPLRSRFRSAVITLIVASASYDIWWIYKGESTRDLEAMNNFPTFFRYDEEAHFRNMIVSLYSLYDKQPRTITIKSLIHELDREAAKPIWRKYRTVHDAVKKITHLRHNVIAHGNADESYADIFKNAGLKPDDLKSLITDSLALLTMIADAIGVERPMVSPFLTDEAGFLMKRIQVVSRADV
jgi:hypothetical protein